MIKTLLIQSINSFERKTGYDASYMKAIAESSPKMAIYFSKLIKLNSYRKKTSLELMAVAKIAAMKAEDCGSCLQLNINYAIWDGVDPVLVETVVKKPEALSGDHRLIYRFATGVAHQTQELDHLRSQIQEKYGRDVLIELSMAIATARVYPSLKRGMGYASSCSVMDFQF